MKSDTYNASFEDFGENFDLLFDNPNKLSDLDAKSINSVLKPFRAKAILDCACGTGIPSIGLARLGYSVSASDISPKLIAILKSKAKKEKLNIEIKTADFTNLKPWKNRKFDAVINSGNSIPLVKNLSTVQLGFDSMANLTKKGGLVITVLHNYSYLKQNKQTFLLRKINQSDGKTQLIFDIRKFLNDRTIIQYIFLTLGVKRKLKVYTKASLNMNEKLLRSMMEKAGLRNFKFIDLITLKRYNPNKHEWFIAIGQKID